MSKNPIPSSDSHLDRQARPRRNLVACLALLIIVVSGGFILQQVADAQRANNQAGGFQRTFSPPFDMRQATIPVDRILRGGPRKDGIPALTNAKFVSANKANFMAPRDRVIGVAVAGQAKAYPFKILDHHEAVNDRLAEKSFTVTYCPLCDSSAVFDRVDGKQEYEFGISGLLYNSNVLLYDRAPDGKESLWSQMAASAVTNKKRGQSLRRLPLEVTTWSDWRTRYPETRVLSDETGFQRSYQGRAYPEYFSSPQLMFPVEPLDQRLAAKTPVLGVLSENAQRAYSLARFAKGQGGRFEDQLDGHKLTLVYDPEHQTLRIERADQGLEWMYSYWFAWAAFYPETDIYSNR